MLPSNDQGGLTRAIFIAEPSLRRRSHRRGLAAACHQPSVQTADAFVDADLRPPAGKAAELADVADIPALVADPPIAKGDRRTTPVQHGDAVDQLQQAQRVFRPAADIERLAGDLRQAPFGDQKRLDLILDKQRVADLLAIAIDRDRLAAGGAQQETRKPAMMLSA